GGGPMPAVRRPVVVAHQQHAIVGIQENDPGGPAHRESAHHGRSLTAAGHTTAPRLGCGGGPTGRRSPPWRPPAGPRCWPWRPSPPAPPPIPPPGPLGPPP